MTDRNDPNGTSKGLKKRLANYGNIDFSLFLRKAFIKGASYMGEALSRRMMLVGGSIVAHLMPESAKVVPSAWSATAIASA